MKNISCIREEKDQLKIDRYNELLENTTREIRDLTKVINLVGNEVRMKLIWLIQKERFCVCDLADILQMTLPAVSQHLRKLKDSGIIESEREGQTIYYRISEKQSENIDRLLKLSPVLEKATI